MVSLFRDHDLCFRFGVCARFGVWKLTLMIEDAAGCPYMCPIYVSLYVSYICVLCARFGGWKLTLMIEDAGSFEA